MLSDFSVIESQYGVKNDHMLVIPHTDSLDNYTKLVQAYGTAIRSKDISYLER